MITASEAKAMADKYNSRPFEVACQDYIINCLSEIERNACRGKTSCPAWIFLDDVDFTNGEVDDYFSSLGFLTHSFQRRGALLMFTIDWKSSIGNDSINHGSSKPVPPIRLVLNETATADVGKKKSWFSWFWSQA